MTHYQDYKANRAHEFISTCEGAGLRFHIADDELCVTFTPEACARANLTWFSNKLEWLNDEVTEIVLRRGEGQHLKLVAHNG